MQGLVGFRVQGLGCRVQGLGCRGEGFPAPWVRGTLFLTLKAV